MPDPTCPSTTHHAGCACHEAQRDAEIARLREALRPFAAYAEARIALYGEHSWHSYNEMVVAGGAHHRTAQITREDWERARQALKGTE